MSLMRIGHSPDPDDAFMFYAFAKEHVTIEDFRIEQVLEDIESLNKRALRGELEVTAISAGAYPRVADKYRIMACGASVGRNYGPIIISRAPLELNALEGRRIAVPGEFTTAYLLLRIYLEMPFVPVFLAFEKIGDAVNAGEVDAGLIIHEGQVTWREQGYANVLDLGKAWGEDTGLPIPLGLDMVHRRLGDPTSKKVVEALRASVRYAMDHEGDAVEYALTYGRGIDRETCRRFVRMYVNEDTINMGEEGRKALEVLYQRAIERKLIEHVPLLDIVGL